MKNAKRQKLVQKIAFILARCHYTFPLGSGCGAALVAQLLWGSGSLVRISHPDHFFFLYPCGDVQTGKSISLAILRSSSPSPLHKFLFLNYCPLFRHNSRHLSRLLFLHGYWWFRQLAKFSWFISVFQTSCGNFPLYLSWSAFDLFPWIFM